jgi:hypothetical protein
MNRNELRESLRYCFEPNLYEMPIIFYDGVWSRISDRQLMSPDYLDELQQACVLQRARTYHNSRFCV